jgi:large subunit ribosomal protein L9
MKVILVKDVDTLGEVGEIKDVSEGYALNFLFSQKLAVRASAGALKDLEARKERIEQQLEQKRQADQANADKVAAISPVKIEANANPDTGKLYGTITTKELSSIIEQKTGVAVERKQINVNAPINQVGEYTVYVKFSAKVSTEFDVSVKAISEEDAA